MRWRRTTAQHQQHPQARIMLDPPLCRHRRLRQARRLQAPVLRPLVAAPALRGRLRARQLSRQAQSLASHVVGPRFRHIIMLQRYIRASYLAYVPHNANDASAKAIGCPGYEVHFHPNALPAARKRGGGGAWAGWHRTSRPGAPTGDTLATAAPCSSPDDWSWC